MKEKLIRKIFFAGPYDLKAVEEYLEEMAATGFMFVKQKGMFYYFESCEPKHIKFAVDFFDKASVFDTRAEKETEEYIAFCEECGWNYLYTNGKLQFFYSELDAPLPIQTDEQVKLRYINKNVLQTRAVLWLLIPLFLAQMFMMMGVLKCSSLVDVFIVNGESVVLVLAYVGIVFYSLMDLLRYIRFYFKNRKRVKLGFPIESNSLAETIRYWKRYMIFLMAILLILLVGTIVMNKWMGVIIVVLMFVIYGAIWGIEMMRQGNRKLTRTENVMITILTTVIGCVMVFGIMFLLVVGMLFRGFRSDTEEIAYYDEEVQDEVIMYIYHDELPFTLEDMGIDTSEAQFNQTEVMEYQTPFGYLTTYSQLPFDADEETYYPDLNYEVLECKWDWLKESYMESLLREEEIQDITEEESDLWNAQQVFACTNEEGDQCGRIVIYEDKVVYINCAWMNYSREEIEFITEKLMNNND